MKLQQVKTARLTDQNMNAAASRGRQMSKRCGQIAAYTNKPSFIDFTPVIDQTLSSKSKSGMSPIEIKMSACDADFQIDSVNK